MFDIEYVQRIKPDALARKHLFYDPVYYKQEITLDEVNHTASMTNNTFQIFVINGR